MSVSGGSRAGHSESFSGAADVGRCPLAVINALMPSSVWWPVSRPQLSAVGGSSCTGKEGGDDSFCAFEFMKGNVSTRLSPSTRVARSEAIWLTWIRRALGC